MRRAIEKVLVNVSRFLLAFVFIFSGFVKANDPYGTVFKLQDYAGAFGLTHIPFFTLVIAAVALAFTEFSLGMHLLFGMSRVVIGRIVVVFMSVMTLLTAYIFAFDPVSDCGCFGDVLILTNGQTLAKNLVLLTAAIINLKYCRLHIKIIGDNTQWLVTMFSSGYILAYSIFCIYALPVLDYRPYKIGTDLRALAEMAHQPSFDVKIVYEKDGQLLELSAEDDDPDSTWHYVETKRIPLTDKVNLKTVNFYVTDAETEEDVTDEILYREGYTFLLVIPHLMHADEGCIDLVNEAYEYAVDNGYAFYCLTGSNSKKAQDYWIDHTGAEYKYYLCDERELKTIVRAAPGLLLLKDGIIINKWSNYTLPDEYVLSDRLENLEIGQLREKKTVLNILMYFFLPLLAFILVDRIGSGFALYRHWKRKSRKILNDTNLLQNEKLSQK
ncbi:MAG: DoxX family protein [Bacteroidaceae bacterium]|nr:DoxX family protein [Bacteroidaceae bacterium]